MVLNFIILVPWMVVRGEITPSKVVNGVPVFGRTHVLNTWALWWGVALMVTASLVSLFSKPQVFTEAFKGLLKKKDPSAAPEQDVLSHIELPLWISWAFIPVVGAVAVWMGWHWFGVEPLMGASALVLILFLSLIAASSTALTSITPSGSLSKIPQFLYGALRPAHPATNLMTAIMAVAPGYWETIAQAAIPPEVPGLAWDAGRNAIAGVVGGIPVTVTADEVLGFAAGEGITPAEAATIIMAAELQPFISGQ
jgi:hypothetical protein